MSGVGPFFTDSLLGDCSYVARSDLRATNAPAAFLGSLVPVSLAVLLLSTPRLRGQWAFRILLFALAFAIAQCLLVIRAWIVDVNTIDETGWHYSQQWADLYNASLTMQWFLPWICDCAILFKVLAFHPPATSSWKSRTRSIAFPLAMHVPRFALILSAGIIMAQQRGPLTTASVLVLNLRLVDSFLAFAENCYCSAYLLYKAHQYACADFAAYNQPANRARLRVRYFTECALFTYLPTTVVQFAYLIVAIVLRAKLQPGRSLSLAEEYLLFLNTAFSVHFGLLAVWWGSTRTQAPSRGTSSSQQHILNSGPVDAVADRNQDKTVLEWAVGPIEPQDDESMMEELKTLTPEEEARLRRRRQSAA